MTLDITQVQYASTIDTFKNFPSTTGSISVPSQSYTAGQYRAFNTDIGLTESNAVTQVLQNFSFSSANYYVGAYVQAKPNSNFVAQTRMTMSGTNLHIDLYVVNQTGSTVSVPAFTVNFEVRRFIAPFN